MTDRQIPSSELDLLAGASPESVDRHIELLYKILNTPGAILKLSEFRTHRYRQTFEFHVGRGPNKYSSDYKLENTKTPGELWYLSQDGINVVHGAGANGTIIVNLKQLVDGKFEKEKPFLVLESGLQDHVRQSVSSLVEGAPATDAEQDTPKDYFTEGEKDMYFYTLKQGDTIQGVIPGDKGGERVGFVVTQESSPGYTSVIVKRHRIGTYELTRKSFQRDGSIKLKPISTTSGTNEEIIVKLDNLEGLKEKLIRKSLQS